MTYIVQKAIEPDDLSAKQREKFYARLVAGQYVLQPKIDGCHVVFVYKAGYDEPHVLSSTGERVLSCDHLWVEYRLAAPADSDVAVLAEVYLPGAQFKDSSGAFRRQSPQPQLRAAVFDFVLFNDGVLSDPADYLTRHKWMTTVGLNPLPIYPANELSYMQAEDWKALGYNGAQCDGGVLKHLYAPYVAKRCRDGEVVKLKPLLDFDLEVIGVDLAHGEKTGKNTAALVCRFKDGVHLRVATGLSQTEVDKLHQTAGDSMIGKIIRVEAMGHSGTGSLREPRYKGVRTDKTNPDF